MSFKEELDILIRYLKANVIFATAVLYFFISASVNIIFSVDIMIPCLIESTLGIHCPGCGLSTAFLNLATFEIAKAWESNPLIFVILPAGTYYLFIDFFRYRKSGI